MNDLTKFGKIPVRNIWLLMLYASEFYQQNRINKFDIEENPEDIPDLVAEFLAKAVEKRLKRNLSYEYQTQNAILNRVRGRIDFFTSKRKLLTRQGKIACRFQELTVDTIRNRFIRAALYSISKIVKKKDLEIRCKSLAHSMFLLGVSGEKPTRAEISRDRITIKDASDRVMVSAAHLAFDLALPTVRSGNHYLPFPRVEINWLRHLYEKAIAGFYKIVLDKKKWRVHAGHTIQWQIEEKTSGIDSILPQMKTDIILENLEQNKRIIIDTKFNPILTKGWYRDSTIRSYYLYQIYAYLRSQENNQDKLSLNSAGILLHPAVDQMINETVKIQGHSIRFATINLNTDPVDIKNQLLEVIQF